MTFIGSFDENDEAIKKEIFDKAYALLMKKGYGDLRLRDVAKSISIERETLKIVFKDKESLITAMFDMKLQPMRAIAKQAAMQNVLATITLQKYAIEVLKFVNNEQTISLSRLGCSLDEENRAFGKLVNEHCRKSMLDYISPVIVCASDAGWFRAAEPKKIVCLFLKSLLGDLQMRLASGALEPLSQIEIEEKSQKSVELVYEIYGA